MGNMRHWSEAELLQKLYDAFEDAGFYSPRHESVEGVYFDAVEPLARQLQGAVEALREIAEQDAMSGVNGKPWRHWRIIAAEALNRLRGQ